MASPHPPGKRILSIDGGGFRGLGCLLVLDALMKEVNERSGRSSAPCEVFDLICGTSTGGLIAILLGRFGLDCQTAIKAYKILVGNLFGDDEQTFWDKLISSSNLDSKQYDDSLEQLLVTYGGHADCLMALPQGETDSIPHESTQVFITIVSDPPDYTNRTHHVRSYPKPPRGVDPPPFGYKWLARQAARATTASSIFMTPAVVRDQNTQHGFIDAAFSGQCNPTTLARRESERLWPKEDIGVVVSLGTGFSSLTPARPAQGWNVTDKYATPFVDEILAKSSTTPSPGDSSQKRAFSIARQFLLMAVDAEIIHLETSSKVPENQIYYRFNPPLGLGNMEIIDCFHLDKVEEAVGNWLTSSKVEQHIRDVAEKLVDLKIVPKTVEEAMRMEPPPPPPDTNIGYNPQLDKPRPDTMLDYLRSYHVVFIVDDSTSMDYYGRWDEARDALAGIAEEAIKYDTDGVDLRFFNSPEIRLGVKGAAFIMDMFDEVRPYGYTPTGAVLKTLLDDEIEKLDAAIDTPDYKAIKPLDIIVLTDGVPTDNPNEVLVEACARMRSSKHHPNAIGLQFVQIGDDEDALEALKQVMMGDINSMVDTVPFDGGLTPKKLERILLGGLHPNIRALLPIASL